MINVANVNVADVNVVAEKENNTMNNVSNIAPNARNILPDAMYEAKASGHELLGARVLPWEGIGEDVTNACSMEEVMRLSGLDFSVEQSELMADIGGISVPSGHFANYRTDNNKILGVVKGRYEVVNNNEAFAFVEDIVKNGDTDVEYNTAGVLKGGRRVWISCKLPSTHILGDEMNPYLVFANSHDGSTGITVSITNIRVWCLNTLNLAIKNGKRAFHFTHCASVKEKMEEAKKTLENYNNYQREYVKEAERLYAKKFTNAEVKAIFDKLFPCDDDGMSNCQLTNAIRKREAIECAYYANDLRDFTNTGWGIVNAVSDYAFHSNPLRPTATYRENRMVDLWNGNKLLDTVHSLVG